MTNVGAYTRAKSTIFAQLAQIAAGSGRLQKLDMLRGIAVLFVLFSHLGIGVYPLFGWWELWHLNFGSIGVFIFFCVSGYVISWSMGDPRNFNGWRAATAFAVRRIFRLLPPYLILAGIIWLVASPFAAKLGVAISLQASPIGYWFRFITLTSFFGGDATVYRGVEWTLAYEVTFYAACTVFIAFFGILGRRWFLYAIIALLCATILLPVGWTNNAVQGFFCNFAFFGIGVLAYLRRIDVLSKKEFLILSILCACADLFTAANVAFTYRLLYSATLASPIAIVVFYAVLFGKQIKVPIIAMIGTVSFSLYLIHGAVIDALPLTGIPAYARPIFWLPISLALGTISFLAIEQPAIRIGKSVARRIARQVATPAVERAAKEW